MNIKHFLLLPLLAISLTHCDDNSNTYEIGKEFADETTKVGYLDTMKVNVSTVLIDSFATSGYNKIVVGNHHDEYLGDISSTSYITFGLENTLPDVDDSTRFDSLVLYIKCNGDYMGDSTIHPTLNVYRLKEDVELGENSSYYYNIDNFDYYDEPIGSATINPRPGKKGSYYIHLPDSLGKVFLSEMVDNSDNFESTTMFLKYFKGIALKCDENSSGLSLGFYGLMSSSSTATDDDKIEEIQIRLYYTLDNEEEASYYAFSPDDSDKIFTSFTTDRSSSMFSSLIGEGNKLPSSETDNMVAMQCGAGIGIKIDIPGIDELYSLNPQNLEILDANLIIHPAPGTYDDENPLPDTLYLYWSDSRNRINSPVYDVMGQYVITSKLTVDNEFDEDTYYSISVLTYIRTELANGLKNQNGLILIPPVRELATSFSRLLVDDQSRSNNSFELQLYYFTY